MGKPAGVGLKPDLRGTKRREPFGKQQFAAQSAGMKDVRLEGVSNPVEIKVLGDDGRWVITRDANLVPPPG